MNSNSLVFWIENGDSCSLDYQDYMKNPVVTFGKTIIGKCFMIKEVQSEGVSGFLVEVECTPEFKKSCLFAQLTENKFAWVKSGFAIEKTLDGNGKLMELGGKKRGIM